MSGAANANAISSATDATGALGGRRRSLQSGYSLLARGEPQIWLTGGTLAVCIALILCLMGLILASGLPTFWPQAADWIVMQDGSADVGELQTVTRTATGGQTLSGGQRSYYYRTENFELSNEHYRWISSDKLQPEGICRLPSVTLFERYESGYLYGVPLRIQRSIAPEADDLAQINASVSTVDNIRQALSALRELPEQVETVQSLERVEAAADAVVRSKKDAALRKRVMSVGKALIQGQLDGQSEWQPLQAIASDAKISMARMIISERSDQLNAFSQLTRDIYGHRHHLERLKRELSRLDARITRLRVAIRQAELDTKTSLPLNVDDCHNFLESLLTLELQQTAIEAVRQYVASNPVDPPTESERLKSSLEEIVANMLKERRVALESQIVDWKQPISSAPESLRVAVDRYLQGYGEVLKLKQPMQRELDRLQSLYHHDVAVVAVPNNARLLNGLAQSDIAELEVGRITDTLAAELSKLELTIANEPSIRKLDSHPGVGLVGLKDPAGLEHLLAVYPGDLAKVALLTEHSVPVEQLVRVIPINELDWSGKLSVYASRWKEFLFEDPREANTLGGVFPAICGTIVMTIIMTVAVVPFGVLAALYLREYTRGGAIVSVIRISINNLAGVPSIVYGVFGFSFFCMTIGSFIDGGPKAIGVQVWPTWGWYAALAVLVGFGTAAFFCSLLSSGPSHRQTEWTRWLARFGMLFWLVSLLTAIAVIFKSPFFHGFYEAQLPNPTFGKGGLLWASMTLALLTLPVVIVATEEALSAVPNSLREGSLACGASKLQTIVRIVLPHARPGILTGAILAMARGAGEVAPLMLVGALPNAPELPMDGEFPFFHGSRNFMHLGYQIYSLGFQSQNSEAAKPMVFTCTLLLIVIVAILNVSAIVLRSQLRRRFQGNQF